MSKCTTLFMCMSLFFGSLMRAEEPQTQLSTYFSYSSQEIESLKKEESHFLMTEASLKKWDKITTALAEKNNLNHYPQVRVFTYLYMAQKEAAFLAYNATQKFTGSLDPISYAILKLFFPKVTLPSQISSDPFSEKLSSIVLPYFKQRFEKEEAVTLKFKVTDEMSRRKETNYTLGGDVAKWIPWVASPEVAYWPKPPPPMNDPEWKNQIAIIKKEQQAMTPERLQAIDYWAGLAGPGSGDWRVIANDYLFSHQLPFEKILLVRAVLMEGIFDSSLVYLSSKYHYLVIRPQVYDPTVTYIIENPNHPSYPAGHSTASTTASLILSYFFPQDERKWKDLAYEAGHSRIWAGIHYPIDNQGGIESGTKVARKIIEENKHINTD